MAGMIPKIGHNGGPRFVEIRKQANGGWVRIERDMRHHDIVGFGSAGYYTRAEAWIDLIMECRYEAGSVKNGGVVMQLVPGQLVGAVSWLAKRWSWTPKEVRGFLDKLENHDMIVLVRHKTETGDQKGKQANIVTICNYMDYQSPEYYKGQTEGQTKGERGANDGPSKGDIYKDNKGTREQGNNLPPSSSYELDGGERERTHNFSPSEDGAELSKKLLNEAWKNADAVARQIKGDKTAGRRTTGGNALDGSDGILFDDGKLSVMNGTAQKLTDEYPGIDLQIACNRAASKVARISNPTRVQVMAAIREYAGYAVQDLQKTKTQKVTDVGDSDIPAALRQTLKNVAPERREKIIAEFREKRNA